MKYSFQFSKGIDLNVPEYLKIEEENKFVEKLWSEGSPENRTKAFEITKQLVDVFQNARAMNNLAWMYETGGVIRRDRAKADTLYRLSMHRGDPLAMSNLADKCIFNEFDCMDVLMGFSLAHTAALMDEKNAKLTLAYCYIKGLGVVPDLQAANDLLSDAGLKYDELPHFGSTFGVTPSPRKIRDLRLAILEMKGRIEESPFVEPLKETVWVSPGLEFYPNVFKNLKEALESRNIPFKILPGKKDKKHVWARDYMPVQIGKGVFLQQKYSPDYLEDAPTYIPDYRNIVSKVKPGRIIGTELVLDGGNILIEGRKAILTDKVFYENCKEDSANVADELRLLLNIDSLYIIPWDMNEPYGHADGMVRFVDDSTVVLNHYPKSEALMEKRLRRFLSQEFTVKQLHFDGTLTPRLNWGYINFLKVGDRLFVPQFGIQEDNQAIKQLRDYYGGCEIIPIFGCEELAKHGGVLNCVTWTVKE